MKAQRLACCSSFEGFVSAIVDMERSGQIRTQTVRDKQSKKREDGLEMREKGRGSIQEMKGNETSFIHVLAVHTFLNR